MNYAHAFWSKPLLNNKFYDFKTSLAITLVDYALSVEFVHKHGRKITLYADKTGAEILSKIPYDKIVIVENDITDNYHFAASMKFIALQQMELSDCLIDGDIFLTNNPIYERIESCNKDFICSFFENKGSIVLEKHQLVLDELSDLKEDFKGWVNTSLMRFQNQELLDKYVNIYKTNVKRFENIEFPAGVWPDIILEQLCLTKLLEYYNFECVLPEFGTPEQEPIAREIGYAHLGNMKREYHNVLVRLLSDTNNVLFKELEHVIDKYTLNTNEL